VAASERGPPAHCYSCAERSIRPTPSPRTRAFRPLLGLVNTGEAVLNSADANGKAADELQNMKRAWSITVGVSLLGCGAAFAQGSADSASAIAACARITEEAARLQCFDELARQAPGRSAESAPGPPTAVNEAQRSGAPPPTGADAAPISGESEASGREARAAERAEREFTSSVTALREIQPGRVEVTLANGQVWRQTHSDRYALLVGHEVKLYPSGFGKYFRLSSMESRGFIQVERVK
jgi:hypothetical protein